MSSHHQQQFAPKMYPEVDNENIPIPPIRHEYRQNPQTETLLQKSPPPPVPERMDRPSPREIQDAQERRNDLKSTSSNSHAIKKIIGLFLFTICLLGSNVMQLRFLILQKQHDGIWIASLVLVIASILVELILFYILFALGQVTKRKQRSKGKSGPYNIIALCIIGLLTVINWIINILMLTINPKSFLDTRSLEILQNQQ